jgi:hypothetical protein
MHYASADLAAVKSNCPILSPVGRDASSGLRQRAAGSDFSSALAGNAGKDVDALPFSSPDAF